NNVHTGYSSFLYFGKFGAVEAKSLIRLDTLTITGSVDSLVLTFNQIAVFAQNTGSVTVHLSVLLKDWNADSICWNAFTSDYVGQTIVSKTISRDDTALVFVLPKEWAVRLVDPQQRNAPYGILVSADPADGMIQVASVESYDYYGTSYTAELKCYINQSTTFVYAIEDAFIATTSLSPRSDRLSVVDGAGLRTLIRFPFSEIPANATVNRALLTLHVDPAVSFPPIQTWMGLTAFMVKDSSYVLPQVVVDSTYGISAIPSTDDSVRVFNITSFVQAWASGTLINAGMLLRGSNESGDVSGLVFFSSAADSTKRPSLDVFFTLPPDPQR
ncbi:MAG TPA: DNRLRE domain-containing protein, partial [bacterium]